LPETRFAELSGGTQRQVLNDLADEALFIATPTGARPANGRGAALAKIRCARDLGNRSVVNLSLISKFEAGWL
jgi:hypothetical protein